MELFIGMGILALAFGLFFIISPASLKTANEWTSKTLANFEEKTFTYRIGVGISLIVESLLFFFVAYYIMIKG